MTSDEMLRVLNRIVDGGVLLTEREGTTYAQAVRIYKAESGGYTHEAIWSVSEEDFVGRDTTTSVLKTLANDLTESGAEDDE